MKVPMILGLIAGSIGALFAAKKVAAMPLPSITINQQPQKENAMTWETPEHGKQYDTMFNEVSGQYDLPPGLLSRVAFQESNYNPTAKGAAGEQGMFQLMPTTAAELGVNPWEPRSAATGAAKYLSRLYVQFGTWAEAIAAYNWGPGNLSKRGMVNAPASTRRYVANVTSDVGIV